MASVLLLRVSVSRQVVARHSNILRFSSVGGFSNPAPKKLDEIVKLNLLSKEPRDNVEKIWSEFHKSKNHNIADVWSTDEFNAFQDASKEAGNMFLFPVPREKGHFNVISQIQGTHILFTYLEDYKTNPHGAQPYLVLTFYKELSKTSNLILVRGDVMPGSLNNEESERLLKLIKLYYLDNEKKEIVSNFSKGIFDFDAHVEKTLQIK